MPVTNISPVVFAKGRSGIEDLMEWLDEHVGQRYSVQCKDPVIKMGPGWEIRVERFDTDEGVASQWILEIKDEKLCTLYCLTHASPNDWM